MVDQVHSATDRAQHLRAACEPGPRSSFLAVATNVGRGMECGEFNRTGYPVGSFCFWLGTRAADYFPYQPL